MESGAFSEGDWLDPTPNDIIGPGDMPQWP